MFLFVRVGIGRIVVKEAAPIGPMDFHVLQDITALMARVVTMLAPAVTTAPMLRAATTRAPRVTTVPMQPRRTTRVPLDTTVHMLRVATMLAQGYMFLYFLSAFY